MLQTLIHETYNKQRIEFKSSQHNLSMFEVLRGAEGRWIDAHYMIIVCSSYIFLRHAKTLTWP
jgi:hypothetical protein